MVGRLNAATFIFFFDSEQDVAIGEEVGYKIAFEDKTSEKTVIKYITDHELVLEAVSDPKLDQYGVVIIDEVRERKLNTDLDQ